MTVFDPPEPSDQFFMPKSGSSTGRTVCLIVGIGLATLLIARLSTVDRIVSLLFLFWHYVVAATIVILASLALVWSRARMACAAIAIALVLSFIWPWLGDLWGNRAVPAMGPSLKVIAFNWKGDSKYHAQVYDWLQREKPDVVSIEEFEPWEPGAPEQMAKLFPYRVTTQGDGDVSLWSRYPIRDHWGQQIYDRSYVTAAITAPGGEVIVYGVHPETLRNDAQLALRNSYFGVLALSIDPRPNIVMLGDFNATRWDPYFARVKAAGRLHEQPWLMPPLTRLRENHPWQGVPIDHVLASRNGRLSNCHTGPALGSDHVPMICNVAFTRSS